MKTEQTTFIFQNCTLPTLEALADINPMDLLKLSRYKFDLLIWNIETVVSLTYDEDENILYITEVN